MRHPQSSIHLYRQLNNMVLKKIKAIFHNVDHVLLREKKIINDREVATTTLPSSPRWSKD